MTITYYLNGKEVVENIPNFKEKVTYVGRIWSKYNYNEDRKMGVPIYHTSGADLKEIYKKVNGRARKFQKHIPVKIEISILENACEYTHIFTREFNGEINTDREKFISQVYNNIYSYC